MSDEKKNDIQAPYRAEDEEVDIYGIHRQAFRESPDPKEGLERPPWWLWVICISLVFWAGFYIGRYGGKFGPEVHLLNEGEAVKQASAPKPGEAQPVAAVDGAEVYNRVCATCHQQTGQGVPGAFPPLAGSGLLTGEDELPVKIVLHGLQGPVTVKGTTYNGVMPAWGGQMSDDEIAAALTYARSSWGNSAPEVSAGTVKQIRDETSGRTTNWTIKELEGE